MQKARLRAHTFTGMASLCTTYCNAQDCHFDVRLTCLSCCYTHLDSSFQRPMSMRVCAVNCALIFNTVCMLTTIWLACWQISMLLDALNCVCVPVGFELDRLSWGNCSSESARTVLYTDAYTPCSGEVRCMYVCVYVCVHRHIRT